MYIRLPRIESDSRAFRSMTDWTQEIKNTLAAPPQKIFGKSTSSLSYIALFKNLWHKVLLDGAMRALQISFCYRLWYNHTKNTSEKVHTSHYILLKKAILQPEVMKHLAEDNMKKECEWLNKVESFIDLQQHSMWFLINQSWPWISGCLIKRCGKSIAETENGQEQRATQRKQR